jgi:N-acetylglucosaminyldiphosphoundecaprenol N-acetyl-beta-D-mannosaminyltransferase
MSFGKRMVDTLLSQSLASKSTAGQKSQTELLGLNIDAQTLDDAVQTLLEWAQDSYPRYVSTCTVYTLMMCQEDVQVMKAVSQADMVTADGMPLVWLQRLSGYAQAERVYGPDIMERLCKATANQPVRHYFWGGLPGVPEKIVDQLLRRFPDLQIAGLYSPPVRNLESTPDPEVIEHLNAAKADVIWVGLGSPKQDLWMSLYRPHLNASLLIGVGAAFDFIAGTKPQAPVWMQHSGLEWLFRFVHEPKRLWRRYIIYNALFLARLIASWVYPNSPRR